MKLSLSFIALVAAMPAFAEDSRQLDAHEHGVGTLNIAVEGTTVAMEFHAPGADIVGFEHAATSDDDHAKVDAAIETLSAPLGLFVLPDAAGCTVTKAQAELESENEHHDHDGEHAKDGDHGHDDEQHHDGDEEHAENEHKDHGDEDHAEHGDDVGHSEFHAEYMLTCENPGALSAITFAYFDIFPNAQEVEVQLVTVSGAQAFEVARDTPVLELGS